MAGDRKVPVRHDRGHPMMAAYVPIPPKVRRRETAEAGLCLFRLRLGTLTMRLLPLFGLCHAPRRDDGSISDDFDVLHLRLFAMGTGPDCRVAETVSKARRVSQWPSMQIEAARRGPSGLF